MIEYAKNQEKSLNLDDECKWEVKDLTKAWSVRIPAEFVFMIYTLQYFKTKEDIKTFGESLFKNTCVGAQLFICIEQLDNIS